MEESFKEFSKKTSSRFAKAMYHVFISLLLILLMFTLMGNSSTPIKEFGEIEYEIVKLVINFLSIFIGSPLSTAILKLDYEIRKD